MAHRAFVDRKGTTWQVWEVVGHPAERHRSIQSASSRSRTRQIPEQRENLARRLQVEKRVALPAEFEQGWLAFASNVDSRRLAPIPAEWMSLSDDALHALCVEAISTQSSISLRDV